MTALSRRGGMLHCVFPAEPISWVGGFSANQAQALGLPLRHPHTLGAPSGNHAPEHQPTPPAGPHSLHHSSGFFGVPQSGHAPDASRSWCLRSNAKYPLQSESRKFGGAWNAVSRMFRISGELLPSAATRNQPELFSPSPSSRTIPELAALLQPHDDDADHRHEHEQGYKRDHRRWRDASDLKAAWIYRHRFAKSRVAGIALHTPGSSDNATNQGEHHA